MLAGNYSHPGASRAVGYIGFRGALNRVVASVSSNNLYLYSLRTHVALLASATPPVATLTAFSYLPVASLPALWNPSSG